jgi:D-serine deaminase-like pyridoxal phosphate-dependent protein
MQISPIGWQLDDLDTPALLLDLEPFEQNIALMSRRIVGQGLQWRPHAKAFKCPAIAHRLRQAGAIGVTVAKVSEAEVMAAGGIDDILIAHLVVGPSKTARLAALQRRADVKTTVDHPDHIGQLGDAARAAGTSIGILVDVDLGMKRCGVSSPDRAVDLARKIERTPGLRFDGIMGYEGHTLRIPDADAKRAAITEAIGRLSEARLALERAGFPCRIVSAGGTGSYQITSGLGGITEIQAGGGIFACRYYTELCGVQGHSPALAVLASVVSRPADDRIILDIGQKSISGYQTPPVLVDQSGACVIGLSAEHTTVEVDPQNPLGIGDKVRVTPGYSDFTLVLHDRILAHRGNRVESVWELLGRGMLQ